MSCEIYDSHGMTEDDYFEISEQQAECEHNWIETIWRRIPGERVEEPDYEMCTNCGKRF